MSNGITKQQLEDALKLLRTQEQPPITRVRGEPVTLYRVAIELGISSDPFFPNQPFPIYEESPYMPKGTVALFNGSALIGTMDVNTREAFIRPYVETWLGRARPFGFQIQDEFPMYYEPGDAHAFYYRRR